MAAPAWYHARLRAQRKAEGICQRCGRVPVTARKTCDTCLTRLARWLAQKKATTP